MDISVLCLIVAIFAPINSENPAELHRIQKRQTLVSTFDSTQDTIFYLFTLNNKDNPDVIKLNDEESLSNSHFNESNPTRCIIHGWENDVNSPVNVLIREAYLAKGFFNIISADWGKAAKNLAYPIVKELTPQIADVVATFINFLCEHGDISVNSIYCIGHSLGAHICGMAGQRLKSDYQKTIPTIFGLDPALPLYTSDTNIILDPTDAAYVQTIQTECGLSGFVKPLGHASFYPNWGGPIQRGCIDLACSHYRAYKFFAETITSNAGFIGHKCANYQEITRLLNKKCTQSGNDALMGGEPSQTGISGVFYLPTKYQSPFAYGQFPYNTQSLL